MAIDPKQGERDYYSHVGAQGIEHSLGKPFTDDYCPQYLAVMTALFSLMAPPPRRIVEFGCGTGWLSMFLAQRGYEVLGIDISEDAIRHARTAAQARQLKTVEFVACDYESFAGQARFDYAIFHDALHHAESELDALRCACAALAPGGCVITLEPGEGHSETEASRHAVAKYQVHEKNMPPSHIIKVARQAGFTKHLTLPHPHQINRLLYRRAYHQAASQSDVNGRRLLSVLRTVRELLHWRTDPGLVMLWK